MKKSLKQLLVVLWVCTIGVSCNDDALDLQPLDAISENSVFNDEALLDAFVKGRYEAVLSLYSGVNNRRLGSEALSDLSVFYRGEGTNEYHRGLTDATNGEGTSRQRWARLYGYNKEINIYFDRIQNSSLPQEVLDRFSAEMRFIRAYIYFDLSKWYGGVPIVTELFGLDDEEFSVQRASYDEVVQYVLSELDQALPNLPSVGDGAPKSRATREAALALKGRVLLYAASNLFSSNSTDAQWQAVADANKDVMDLTTIGMNDNYADMFEPGELEDEVIFAREFVQSNSQGGSWGGANVLLMPSGFQGWGNLTPNQKFVDMFEMTNGETPYLPDGSVNPASGFDPQNPYVDRDPRFYDIILYNEAPFKDRTCEYYIDKDNPDDGNLAGRDSNKAVASGLVEPWNASPTNYNYRKHVDERFGRLAGDWSSASLGPDIVFRKAEAYLNYAEAQIELGNDDEARNALNVIRSRNSVNMPPIPSSVSGNDLLEAYRRERAIELALEDQRFHDIRRWRIAEDVLGQTMYGVTVLRNSSDGSFEYSYDLIAADNRAFDAKQYLLPIPLDEITKTGGALEQNPGY